MSARRTLGLMMFLFAWIGNAAAGGDWMSRPESMHQLWLQDVDRHEGTLRILYSTTPSLPQGRQDDWTINFYLVTAQSSGDPVQHQLYSGQRERYAALEPMLLRRGHDEVLVTVRAPDGNGAALETRTVPDWEQKHRASIPQPVSNQGDPLGGGPMREATSDGNAFWSTTRSEEDGDRTIGVISWFKMAPEGRVIGSDLARTPGARARVTGWFAAGRGGIGLVTDTMARDNPFLPSRADDSRDYQVGDRTITVNVSGEVRLLVTDPSGGEWQYFGPPLAQEVRWSGDQAIPQGLPHEQALEQNNRQMQLRQQAAAEFRAQRSFLEGLRGVRIRNTPSGYATMAKATVARRMEPPAHGWYFIEVGPEALRREIRVEPLFDEMNLEPIDVHVADNDDVFILAGYKRPSGQQIGVVLHLDPEGEAAGQIPVMRSDESHVELKTLMPSKRGFWIVGRGQDPEAAAAIWLEHVAP